MTRDRQLTAAIKALHTIGAQLSSVTGFHLHPTFGDTYRIDQDGRYLGSVSIKGRGPTLQAYLFVQPKGKTWGNK